MADRTGQKFGNLTIIKDSSNSQILCRCDCGVEELFPRTITKPTYKGRKMCSYCKGGICEVCGARIQYKSGRIPATCSELCSKSRYSEKERLRYQKVKDTDEYKETRTSYLNKLKDKLNSDPDFYRQFRIKANEYLRKSRAKPMQVIKANLIAKERYQAIKNDPASHEQYVLYQRRRYDTLTEEDYKRIFKRIRSHTRTRKSRVSYSE